MLGNTYTCVGYGVCFDEEYDDTMEVIANTEPDNLYDSILLGFVRGLVVHV